MKLTLDVRNVKKIIKPTKNDVILYDGKEWYVTTKEDLFKDFKDRLDEREEELEKKSALLDKKMKEFDQIKKENAKQIADMARTLREHITGGSNK